MQHPDARLTEENLLMNLDSNIHHSRLKYYSFSLDFFIALMGVLVLASRDSFFLLLLPALLAGFYAFRCYEAVTHHHLHRLIQGILLSNIIVYTGLILLGMFFSIELSPSHLLIAFSLTTVLPLLAHVMLEKSDLYGPRTLKVSIPPQLLATFQPLVDEITSQTQEKVHFNSSPGLKTSPDFMLPAQLKKKNTGKEKEFEISLIQMCENTLRKIPPSLVQKFPDVFSPYFRRKFYDGVSRFVNLLLALVLSLLFMPIMGLLAILIYLEDGSPVFIRQKRIGRDGKPFMMVKFRSMREENFDSENPNSNIEDRILKIGHFIRKTRLDETLQFYNVLKGDMNIIGPRPELEVYHEKYDGLIPYYSKRLVVRPGITGWAQVVYKHTTNLDDYIEKTAYDLYYIKNRNLLLDIKIVLKTVETVLGTRGAR